MNDAVSSAREALIAQLLQDVDELVARLETVDQDLGARIEDAVRDASGQAFLRARLELEAGMDRQAGKLEAAGRHAAAMIGESMRDEVAAVMAGAAQGRRAARLAICAGLIGCVAGASAAVMAVLAGCWLR